MFLHFSSFYLMNKIDLIIDTLIQNNRGIIIEY